MHDSSISRCMTPVSVGAWSFQCPTACIKCWQLYTSCINITLQYTVLLVSHVLQPMHLFVCTCEYCCAAQHLLHVSELRVGHKLLNSTSFVSNLVTSYVSGLQNRQWAVNTILDWLKTLPCSMDRLSELSPFFYYCMAVYASIWSV